jgi:FixJ family two-component response regulator
VIDDDPEILDAFCALLELEGYACETHGSALSFLDASAGKVARFPGPCCVLCDVMMPGLSGLGLLARLGELKDTPVLLMSGVSGASEAVSAFHAGAQDFLIKPIDADLLLGAVGKALAMSTEMQQQRARADRLAGLFGALTAREIEIAHLIAQGMRNQEVADALGIALRTVKRHRHQVMEKLGAQSLAELVRIIDEAGHGICREPGRGS